MRDLAGRGDERYSSNAAQNLGFGSSESELKDFNMWEFVTAGGVFMIPLLITSVVAVAFIIERGLALRWEKVIPPRVEQAAENLSPDRIPELRRVCEEEPSTFSRLLVVAQDHLNRPRDENVDAVQTHA